MGSKRKETTKNHPTRTEERQRTLILKNGNIQHQLNKRDQSKGGKRKTVNKKVAAKLRELKKRGLTNETAKELGEIMTHPELSVLDMRVHLMKWRKKVGSPKEAAVLERAISETHKLHYGSAEKSEVSVSVDNRTQSLVLDVGVIDKMLLDAKKRGSLE